MRKSEMIRAALARVHRLGPNRKVCYCTPSREMLHNIEYVAMNNVHGNYQTADERRSTARELIAAVGAKLREVTNRTEEHETLERFDTEDTEAAYSLDDELVEEAFEKAALAYEEEGD